MTEINILLVDLLEKASSLMLAWLDDNLVKYLGIDANHLDLINTTLQIFSLIGVAVLIFLRIRSLQAANKSWHSIIIRMVLFLIVLILALSFVVQFFPTKTLGDVTPPEETDISINIKVEDLSYSQAMTQCQENGWHLATFTNEEEFEQITSKIPEAYRKYQLYIGAFRLPGATHYYCHNDYQTFGSPIDEMSGIWHEGEPSFFDWRLDLEETYVAIYWSSVEQKWLCNDVSDTFLMKTHDFDGLIGYVYFQD